MQLLSLAVSLAACLVLSSQAAAAHECAAPLDQKLALIDAAWRHLDILPEEPKKQLLAGDIDGAFASLRTLGFMEPHTMEAIPPNTLPAAPAANPSPSLRRRLGVAEIVQIGEKIWEVVKNNQAVLNETGSGSFAGCVPKDVQDSWSSIGPWKDAITDVFRFIVKDPLGIPLSELQWIFVWKHGAKYNGTGAYVTQAGVKVKKVYAHIWQTVNVMARAFDAVNYGDDETGPIGGIDLEVRLEHSGPFFKRQMGCHFNVRGDGTGKVIVCDMNEGRVHPPQSPTTTTPKPQSASEDSVNWDEFFEQVQ